MKKWCLVLHLWGLLIVHVSKNSSQKHWRYFWWTIDIWRTSFQNDFKQKKKNRNIGLLHNLKDLLIRPYFDYGDFRYEQTLSFSFDQKPAITSLLFQSNSQENFVKLSPTRIRFYYSKFGIVSSKALFFRLRLFHAKA